MNNQTISYQDLIHLADRKQLLSVPKDLPRQRLPKFFRYLLQMIVLPFIWLDILAVYLARQLIKVPYKRAGSCKKRGNCCQFLLIEKPKGFLSKLYLNWQIEMNGFFLRHLTVIEDRKIMQLMGCRHLRKDGQCGNYFLRPMICRQWPQIEGFAQPRVLKGCGFFAMRRKD